eukprot:TRINITY_DN1_c0_g1_i10.p1 TRINITY_DN1_c0_g1~~TRINITY_DN1_c0_g1_i10.p1  ORF type:complete len:191 (+),score=19.85 TRINITY_DN1_c0_g1_i10:88-660(+)
MIFLIIFLGKLSAIVFLGKPSIVTSVLYICSCLGCLGALFLIILLMIFLIIFLGKLSAIVFLGKPSIVTSVLYICSCLGALNQCFWIIFFCLGALFLIILLMISISSIASLTLPSLTSSTNTSIASVTEPSDWQAAGVKRHRTKMDTRRTRMISSFASLVDISKCFVCRSSEFKSESEQLSGLSRCLSQR